MEKLEIAAARTKEVSFQGGLAPPAASRVLWRVEHIHLWCVYGDSQCLHDFPPVVVSGLAVGPENADSWSNPQLLWLCQENAKEGPACRGNERGTREPSK